MGIRQRLRLKTADYLNSLSLDELFSRYKITRVSRIDGLDCIGVPVYSVCRPEAATVSVNAGKSLDARLARAGAIAEGIEFATFENPEGEFYVDSGLMNPVEWFPFACDSEWTPETPFAQEDVRVWGNGSFVSMPSDLVWLIRRAQYDGPTHFQMTSNGQAIGASFEDALLQGLYECVERDQTVLRMCSESILHVWPPRVEMPENSFRIRQCCDGASLKLFLFHCPVDIQIPCYWAVLADPYGGCGTFGGWGCDLNPNYAASRAILEAIQSRAVYISGARDDIERRNFDELKARDPSELIAELEALPVLGQVPEGGYEYESVEEELRHARELLGPWAEQVCYKHIDLGELHAVKVIILGMEQPITKHWKSMRWAKLVESCSRDLASTDVALSV
jgi:YcaO-like protein with predicted kinase domain